ncbi:MAG: HIT family protein [Oligosphaeraceae bacterium]|nr:HIT family protein [Oligosphaeraceae bacterium]
MPLVNDCVFCKIIQGEIPCSKVYEDDLVLAFLDIAPFNYGHALIVPKDHHHSITTLPQEYLTRMMCIAPKIAVAQMRELKAEGFNLLLNNGRCAGQEVPHCHLHVIPRLVDDAPLLNISHKKYSDTAAMNELAASLQKRIDL